MMKLTGLWKEKSKEGKVYYVGDLGPMLRVLIFPNKNKTKDSHPDFELFLDRVKPSEKEEPEEPDEM